jgi:hypothetical protein
MIKFNHTKYRNVKKFPDNDTLSCEVKEVFGGKYVYVFSGKTLQTKLYFG